MYQLGCLWLWRADLQTGFSSSGDIPEVDNSRRGTEVRWDCVLSHGLLCPEPPSGYTRAHPESIIVTWGLWLHCSYHLTDNNIQRLQMSPTARQRWSCRDLVRRRWGELRKQGAQVGEVNGLAWGEPLFSPFPSAYFRFYLNHSHPGTHPLPSISDALQRFPL